jgi:hypothetical protein
VAFTQIAHAVANGNPATTPSRDITGANLIVVELSSATTSNAPSDGVNTFLPLTQYSGFFTSSRFWYCVNPVTSTTYQVSTTAGSIGFITLEAWSGAATSQTPNDNGTVNSGAPYQPGSITTLVNGSLVLTALICPIQDPSSVSVDLGFVVDEVGASGATNVATVVQSAAGAINPTWTCTVDPSLADVLIAAFAPTASFDAATFPWGQQERPAHYSKVTLIDSGPKPGESL